jgi:hypothetical protein
LARKLIIAGKGFEVEAELLERERLRTCDKIGRPYLSRPRRRSGRRRSTSKSP